MVKFYEYVFKIRPNNDYNIIILHFNGYINKLYKYFFIFFLNAHIDIFV